MTKRRKTKHEADLEKVYRDMLAIRDSLETEVQILCQSYPPRTVLYSFLAMAIRLAPTSGVSPEAFLALCRETVKLYTGEAKASSTPGIIIVEMPDDE